MKTKTKPFDAVQMKRQAAARIYESIKGMSVEEELEYWRKRTEELRAEQEDANRRRTKAGEAA